MTKEDVKMSGHESNKVSSTRSSSKSLKAEDRQEETPRINYKRQRTPGTVNESNTIKYDKSLVGSKVKVWWSYYDSFNEGVIGSFDHVKKKHKVYYVDGDVEVLNLRQERWEFVDDVSVNNGDAEVEHSCHDTSSYVELKDIATESGGKSKDDGKPVSKIKVNNSMLGSNYVDDADINPQKLGAESQSGKTLTKTSFSPMVKESGTTLPKTTPSKESDTIKYDNSLVGSKVKVWWQYYGRFYEGVIASFDHVKRKHKVCYADGDVELLNLRRERWEFVDDVSVKNGDADVEHSCHDTSFDAERQKMHGSSKRKQIDTKTEPGGKLMDDGKPETEIKVNNSKGKSQAIKSTLSQMLDEGIHAGVNIITSDGSFNAHKSSSLVFNRMCSPLTRGRKVSSVEIKEMTTESCMALLSFLYGSLHQEAFLKHRLDLLGAANKYDIVDLKEACEQSLLEDINSGNVLEKLEQAWLYQLDKLKKGCFIYLLDSKKIYDVREEMNEFLKRADRGLLAEMFQEVLAILKQS